MMSKRVRFGTGSSDELDVQVREFELDEQTSPEQEEGVVGAPHPPINESSAPSSTSTATSSNGGGTRGLNSREILLQAYAHPRRLSRYAAHLSREGSAVSSQPVEYNVAIDPYAWVDDHGPPAMRYEEVLPPAPPSRRREVDLEGRWMMSSAAATSTVANTHRPTYAQLQDSEVPVMYDRQQHSSSPAYGVYNKTRSNSVSFQRAQNSAAADYWREEPLPQGVPLILGPHGQWRYYNPSERSVIFDAQRNSWVTAPRCECASGRRCALHANRVPQSGNMPPPPHSNDWSEDEYQDQVNSYAPPRKQSDIHYGQPPPRRIYRDTTSSGGAPTHLKPPPHRGGGYDPAWLNSNHSAAGSSLVQQLYQPQP